jgi:TldD protein
MKLEALAAYALDYAAPLVDYVEVRAQREFSEELAICDSQSLPPGHKHALGLGIRIWHGGWGFASTCQLDKDAVKEAVQMARALAGTGKVKLSPPARTEALWQGPLRLDPFTIPLFQKLELLGEIEGRLRCSPQIVASKAAFIFTRGEQLFLNSTGARIRQTKTESGYSLRTVAAQGTEHVTRSYPNCLGGGFAQAGFEYIQEANLPREAERIAREATALLSAPPAPQGKLDLLLVGNQLALQIHESIGHALELDRALGSEESLAGGSFLTPDRLGEALGSKVVNITADATLPGGVGSFGFDDEGISSRAIPLVSRGIPVGYLTSREHNLGQSCGAMRAASWRDLPLIRMTNVNLEPGEETLEELIRGIEYGLLLDTPNSWSIDQRRENFQFTSEAGYLIRRGKLQGLVRSPLYRGDTAQFWSRCDGISREAQWQTVPNCGKGLPLQVVRVGHKVAPARFREIDVAFGGRR